MTVVVDPTTGSTNSGITLDDIVRRVRRRLQDRDEINKLAADIDDSVDTITLKYKPSNLTRGSFITFDDEVVQVWDNTNSTITVERAQEGTTAAYHDANTLVYVGGKSRRDIVDAINDELMSLSANDLYQMRSISLADFSAGTWSYQVDELSNSNIYDIEELTPGQLYEWRHVPNWSFNSIDNTVTLGSIGWSNNYRILYKAPFIRMVDGGEDIQSDAGLQAEAADLLMWGACWRLTIGDEYIRNDFRTQGDTRRPDEVGAGAVARSSAFFKSMRDERMSEERDRLKRRFKPRKPGW